MSPICSSKTHWWLQPGSSWLRFYVLSSLMYFMTKSGQLLGRSANLCALGSGPNSPEIYHPMKFQTCNCSCALNNSGNSPFFLNITFECHTSLHLPMKCVQGPHAHPRRCLSVTEGEYSSISYVLIVPSWESKINIWNSFFRWASKCKNFIERLHSSREAWASTFWASQRRSITLGADHLIKTRQFISWSLHVFTRSMSQFCRDSCYELH